MAYAGGVIKARSGRRVISPAGFLLALLCFGLPFLTVSCESPVGSVRASYSGWDLAFGGAPDITASLGMSDYLARRQQEASVPWQLLALLTVLAIIAGVFLTCARPRQQTLSSIIAGGSALLLLIINQTVVHSGAVDELRRDTFLPATIAQGMVENRVGFWLALLLLLGVVGYHVLELVRQRRAGPAPPVGSGRGESDSPPPRSSG